MDSFADFQTVLGGCRNEEGAGLRLQRDGAETDDCERLRFYIWLEQCYAQRPKPSNDLFAVDAGESGVCLDRVHRVLVDVPQIYPARVAI